MMTAEKPNKTIITSPIPHPHQLQTSPFALQQLPASSTTISPVVPPRAPSSSTSNGGGNGSIQFMSLLGQGRVNQLGGTYINGRPLPYEVRLAIVRMAEKGIKPVRISRELQVSHGAVSKILNRFNETGSIHPGQIGGPNLRHRMPIQALKSRIQRLRSVNPKMSAVEIRQALISSGICHQVNAPTTSAINRHLKSLRHLNKGRSSSQQILSSLAPSSSFSMKQQSIPSLVSGEEIVGASKTENGTNHAGSKNNAGVKIDYSIERILGSPKVTAPISNGQQQIALNASTTTAGCCMDDLMMAGTSSFLPNSSSSSAISSSSTSDEENNLNNALAATNGLFEHQNFLPNNHQMVMGDSALLPPFPPNYEQTSAGGGAIRRSRTSFSGTQLRRLEAIFVKKIYPSPEEVEELVKQTGLDEDKVRTWFSNRRARSRKVLFGVNNNTMVSSSSLVPPPVSTPGMVTATNILQKPLLEKMELTPSNSKSTNPTTFALPNGGKHAGFKSQGEIETSGADSTLQKHEGPQNLVKMENGNQQKVPDKQHFGNSNCNISDLSHQTITGSQVPMQFQFPPPNPPYLTLLNALLQLKQKQQQQNPIAPSNLQVTAATIQEKSVPNGNFPLHGTNEQIPQKNPQTSLAVSQLPVQKQQNILQHHQGLLFQELLKVQQQNQFMMAHQQASSLKANQSPLSGPIIPSFPNTSDGRNHLLPPFQGLFLPPSLSFITPQSPLFPILQHQIQQKQQNVAPFSPINFI